MVRLITSLSIIVKIHWRQQVFCFNHEIFNSFVIYFSIYLKVKFLKTGKVKQKSNSFYYLFSPRHLYKPTKARRLGKSYIGKGMGSQGKGRKQEEKSHWKREEKRNFHQDQKQLPLDKALSFLVMLVILLTLELWETQAQAALMAPKWFSKTRKLHSEIKVNNWVLIILIFRAGNRKQFLIADSRTIYAFAQKGQKFPTCTSFSDKTCDVLCKVRTNIFSVVNLKSINQFVFRLLMVLILFLSQDQNQRLSITGFTLVMTVSGLIWTR